MEERPAIRNLARMWVVIISAPPASANLAEIPVPAKASKMARPFSTSALNLSTISSLVNLFTISTPFSARFFYLSFLPAPFEPIFEKVHQSLGSIEDGEDVDRPQDEKPALRIGTDEVFEEYND